MRNKSGTNMKHTKQEYDKKANKGIFKVSDKVLFYNKTIRRR